MEWKKNILVIVTMLIMIGLMFYVENSDMQYNNVDDKDILITTTYSVSEIEKIQHNINYGGMSFKDLESEYNIQCLRKTSRGYYVILKEDAEKYCYVFMSSNLKVENVMDLVENFKTKEEFEAYVTEGMTQEEVEKFDVCTIDVPISSICSTVHYVEEGVFVLTYLRNSKMYTVDKIYFYSNEECINGDDQSVLSLIPFILEIDRYDKG